MKSIRSISHSENLILKAFSRSSCARVFGLTSEQFQEMAKHIISTVKYPNWPLFVY